MNAAERIVGIAVTLARVGRVVAERKIQGRSSKDSPNPVFLLMLKDYHRLLGISGSPDETEATGVIDFCMAVTHYIFWCDGYLDSRPIGIEVNDENFTYRGITHQERLDNIAKKAQGLAFGQNRVEDILDILHNFRRNVWNTHGSFFPKFNPLQTSFDQVMNYVDATTGATAEVLIHIMGSAAGVPESNIERATTIGRRQANAFQMTDDLVDSVDDYGRRINLFNALLLNNSREAEKFSQVIRNQKVLKTHRPFQIASTFSPETLKEYMQRFCSTVSKLPDRQRNVSRGFMATGTFMSFTPQSETSFNPISLFLPKTKIDYRNNSSTPFF